MRRAASSFLLARSYVRSVPRLIENPNPNTSSHRQHENIRHFNTIANPAVTSNSANSVLIRERVSCPPYLPSCALRSFATFRESSKESAGYGVRDLQKKSQATLMYLIALVIAMVGCSYAAVPLYRKFCQATGYGGTVRRRETVEEKIARHAQDETTTRQLVVQFNADIADGLPWKFMPTQREVKVKPGQSTLAFFTAENLSSKPITGVSTYNVTPMKAGAYFNKIQCFCFEEQRLLPGEKIDMPVFFYIDPEFATDPKMDNVNNLILSYTFFKVEDEEEPNAK
eukprot:c18314_g1_i1 orf=393-1244(-)